MLDMRDVPFLPPPDAPLNPAPIVLDLPVPPSVNSTRRIDYNARKTLVGWIGHCDTLLLIGRRERHGIKGQFGLRITVSEKYKGDLDNILKALIDYLRRIELIEDDSPKYMRRLTVEWGYAPEGCRVVIEAVTEVQA